MDRLNSILLVDDDDAQNFINQRLLKKLDIAENLLVAQNGEIAMDLIRAYCQDQNQENWPRLIFLDINMPVLNGIGFLRAFDSLNCPGKDLIKIVVLSTSLNPCDQADIQNAGITDFLNKPLTKEMVSNIIDKYFA